jgi:predicted esterase
MPVIGGWPGSRAVRDPWRWLRVNSYMMRSAFASCVGVLLLAPALVAQNRSLSDLRPGAVIPRQTCAKPEQSYALYLPSHYDPGKRWPIIYAFDPDARGSVPVELMKDAAERYGYIVVGSNNSRNGSWKLESESAQAMFDDTHARLAIDDRRIYFAGFSGGARVAAVLAQRCKCAAGVLLDGAGFGGPGPSRDAIFAVFATAGTYDFNYPELSELEEKLDEAGFPHLLRHFDGPHEWAPVAVIEQALAWFRLIAMKQGREARDPSFIAQQETSATALAQALEQSGQLYEAWREYRQAATTFDGLADIAALQQAATSLAKQKAVRDGPKREKQESEEQKELTAPILAGLASLGSKPKSSSDIAQPESPISTQQPRSALPSPSSGAAGRTDTFQQTEQQIVDLREHAASEKRQEKMVVYRRTLAGIFIAAGEAGDENLSARNYALAKEDFQLASDANPDSAGALRALATARALDNDRKGALEALHRAKQKSKDLPEFSVWLTAEPAFANLHEDPQFRALLANP